MASITIKSCSRAGCVDIIYNADGHLKLQAKQQLFVQAGCHKHPYEARWVQYRKRRAFTAGPDLLSRKCLYLRTSLEAFDQKLETGKVVTRATKTRCSLNTEMEESATYHVLPDGKRLEVLERKANQRRGSPVVFIPGVSRAAWCYEAHWLDYFAEAGHDSYAISLMGQGKSDVADGPVSGTLFSHAENIADVICARVVEPPVLVGHSFGGLAVQAYLSKLGTSDDSPGLSPLAGAVLVCSATPTGSLDVMKRRSPDRASKLANQGYLTDLGLCRDACFSPDMPDSDVAKYQKLLAGSSKQPLVDPRVMMTSLPVSKPPQNGPPLFVMGAADDFLVDKEGLEETAAYFGTEAVTIPNIGHDVMLDVRWKDAANAIVTWLSERGL